MIILKIIAVLLFFGWCSGGEYDKHEGYDNKGNPKSLIMEEIHFPYITPKKRSYKAVLFIAILAWFVSFYFLAEYLVRG